LCSSDSEKSERKAKKEEKKRKVMPGPVHFGSNEPVILAELDPQVLKKLHKLGAVGLQRCC
jgi:hypothetical protein